MSVLALIPARLGSKGVSQKNFRDLGGKPLWRHAVDCALESGVWPIVSSDAPRPEGIDDASVWIARPADLASDSAPMLAVVQHALEQIPGPPDQTIVLLQPTAVFRTPERVREAMTLLEQSGADSVVSVVPLPLTHGSLYQCHVTEGRLVADLTWGVMSIRRQDAEQKYIRDGTVYCFRRETISKHGNIYGQSVVPLVVSPRETCSLDTEDDWAEVERRFREQSQGQSDARS